jgi:cytosine/adenosine deaminase-related metal-dependent hydrolase
MMANLSVSTCNVCSVMLRHGKGHFPLINVLKAYDLIKSPSDILLSHATGLSAQEKAALVETRIPVSSTPEVEVQMGFGWPIAFTPGVNFSFGVDCHSNTSASILVQARQGLQQARQAAHLANVQDGKMALKLRGSAEEAFNAATIRAARAVQLGDKIGSIKEGKLADLVIFDTLNSTGMSCVAESDPLTAVLRHSDVKDIEAVMIDGVWRKKDGKLLPVTVEETGKTLTWPEIRGNLKESQTQILKRQQNLNMEKAKEALVAMFRIEWSNLIEKE